MDNLLRPSLQFISKLPTIKIKETIYKETVVWEVSPPKPVTILCETDCVTLNKFCIECITLRSLSRETGWRYSLKIGISEDEMSRDYIITPWDEEYYLNSRWWEWYKPRPALLA